MIDWICPSCQTPLTLQEEFSGSETKCNACAFPLVLAPRRLNPLFPVLSLLATAPSIYYLNAFHSIGLVSNLIVAVGLFCMGCIIAFFGEAETWYVIHQGQIFRASSTKQLLQWIDTVPLSPLVPIRTGLDTRWRTWEKKQYRAPRFLFGFFFAAFAGIMGFLLGWYLFGNFNGRELSLELIFLAPEGRLEELKRFAIGIGCNCLPY